MQLINNPHRDRNPDWSPDGTRIAFDRLPDGLDTEIVIANADGSGPYALTDNAALDSNPSWSALGDSVLFESARTGNYEVFASYLDGSVPTNLTQSPATSEFQPDCSPVVESGQVAFVSDRDGNLEVYRMGTMGQSQTRLTNSPNDSSRPAYSADGFEIAYMELMDPPFSDIWITSGGGLSTPYAFRQAPGDDAGPSWSHDDRFIAFASLSAGDYELMVRETREPYRVFQITNNALDDFGPDLGSPTMQVDRVIVGPSGCDWGGYNPIWSYSDAGIAAYGSDGYRSFVRLGIAPANLGSLSITPLVTTAIGGIDGGLIGGTPVGVVVEATEIANLREDGGRGATPVLWAFTAPNPTAVVLYFNPQTGKLVAALVLEDQTSPAGAGAAGGAVTQRAESGGVVAEGAFAAVFDATGARVADASSAVRIAGDQVSVPRAAASPSPASGPARTRRSW